jgi:type II secretory pathway predicted ATPase ExeA
MLAYLAAELDPAHESATASIDASVRRLQHFLHQNATQGRHAVIAIDEAHLLLDSNGLETVRLMLNFDRAGRPALTLLLLGTPALLTGLERMPALDQRLGVKCLLRPLTMEETISYVNHRLTAAGAKQEIFTSDALQSLYQLTLGNPRLINRLCDLALLIGYAEEQPSVGQTQLEAVSNELVTVQPE